MCVCVCVFCWLTFMVASDVCNCNSFHNLRDFYGTQYQSGFLFLKYVGSSRIESILTCKQHVGFALLFCGVLFQLHCFP